MLNYMINKLKIYHAIFSKKYDKSPNGELLTYRLLSCVEDNTTESLMRALNPFYGIEGITLHTGQHKNHEKVLSPSVTIKWYGVTVITVMYRHTFWYSPRLRLISKLADASVDLKGLPTLDEEYRKAAV